MSTPNPASTAPVPPAAAPASAAPVVPETPKPAAAEAPAPATPTPAAAPAAQPAEKKEGAAAEPAPATKPEPKPAEAQPAAALTSADVKLPEGSLLHPKAVEEIVSLANAKKLSKEDTQAMLDRESKAVSSYVEGEKEKATKTEEQWFEASKTDKEFGGDAYEVNVELGNRVLKKYGTPAFESLLKDSGAHLHPEVQRFLIRIGKAMNPAELVTEGAAGAGGALPRLADRLYGEPKKADAAPAA